MLSPGDELGRYEILERIGAGGMGEVFRARDTDLGRDVAIKTSAERFSERFHREAKLISSLNHPNICTLYDVGPDYLVMEYIEGPALDERIRQGSIPVDEALEIARQIGLALEEAHGKQVVHRDLKPGNVKIRTDGVVKVLDFGLAKALVENRAASDETRTLGETQAGMILGTPAYMSPEQARGQTVDKRADIWSFGVVLYEMLTGQRLFRAETTVDTLSEVVNKEPDWQPIPAKVQPLLKRCLEKDARKRLRDISGMDLLLEGGAGVPSAKTLGFLWPATAAIFAAGLIALAVIHFRETRAQPELTRFEVSLPDGVTPTRGGWVSPDGRKIVFTGIGSDGVRRLWLRTLDSGAARPMQGTETNVDLPLFWSWDSRFVAFEQSGRLKKVDIAGGPSQTICDLPTLFVSGSWNREGVILLGNGSGGILRVPAGGGAVVPVTALNSGRSERIHTHPVFLPDGRHFLYLRGGGAQDRGIYIGSLDTKPGEQSMQQLVATGYGAAYALSSDPDTGHLLYLREGTLLAQPFDARRLRLTGDPVPVAEQVMFNAGTDAYFSASSNGVLAYRSTGGEGIRLTWFDRQGRASGNLGDAEFIGQARGVAISPDGTRAATEKSEASNQDIWLLDLARGGRTRFTFHPATDASPVWSPDGTQIIFQSNRSGRGIADLYRKASSGAGDEELLLKSDQSKIPLDWSRDGRFLLYMSQDPKTRRDLWVLPMEGERTPFPFLRTEFDENEARFSPDGRWVAYSSNETGASEVYVQPFNAPNGSGRPVSGKWLVSKDAGAEPRWRRDGKEILYRSFDGRVISVEVKASVVDGSPVFESGEPKALFAAPGISGWDVAPDGNRFLVYAAPPGNSSTPINVVLDWQALLKR